MSTRTLFIVLLCSTMFLPGTQNTAQAQNGLRLVSSSGTDGGPLASDTKVRVFPIEYSTIGNKSVDLINLPKGVGISDLVFSNGWTNESYNTTDKTGTHYFVYALTPDDDVYVSFGERTETQNPQITAIDERDRNVHMRSLEAIPGVTAKFFNDVRRSIFGAPPADFNSKVDPAASMTARAYIRSQQIGSASSVEGEQRRLNLMLRGRVPLEAGTDVRVVPMRLNRRGSFRMSPSQLLEDRGTPDQVGENGYTANSYPVTTSENLTHYLVFAADPNGVVHVSSTNSHRAPVLDQLVSGNMWMKRLTEIEGMTQEIFDQVRQVQFGLPSVPFVSEIPVPTASSNPPEVESPQVVEAPRRTAEATPASTASAVNLTLIGPGGRPLAEGTQIYVYQETYSTVGAKRVELNELPTNEGDLDELIAGGITRLRYEPTTASNKTHYLVYAAEPDGSVYVNTSSGVAVYDQVVSGQMTMRLLESMDDVPQGLVVDIQRRLVGQIPLIVLSAEHGSLFPRGTELRVLMRAEGNGLIVDDLLPAGKAAEASYEVEEVLRDRINDSDGRSELKYLSTQFHNKSYLVYAMIPGTDILYVSTNSQLSAPLFDQLQTGRLMLAPASKISGFAPDKARYSGDRAESIAEVKRVYFATPGSADPFLYIVSGILMISVFGGYMVLSAISKRRRRPKKLRLDMEPPAKSNRAKKRPRRSISPGSVASGYHQPGGKSVSPRPRKPSNGFPGRVGQQKYPPKESPTNATPEPGRSTEEEKRMQQDLEEYKKLLKKAGDKIEKMQQERDGLIASPERKDSDSQTADSGPIKPIDSNSGQAMPGSSNAGEEQRRAPKQESRFRDNPFSSSIPPPPRDAKAGPEPSLEELNEMQQKITEYEKLLKKAGDRIEKQEQELDHLKNQGERQVTNPKTLIQLHLNHPTPTQDLLCQLEIKPQKKKVDLLIL